MALPSPKTPQAEAAVTTPDSATGNGQQSSFYEAARSSPIWLIPAERSAATEAFGPLWLAPPDARIVAVGRHDFLPIAAVAWVSNKNEIIVAIAATLWEAGRSVLIRVWTRDSNIKCRSTAFAATGEQAVAAAAMGEWDGLPVAGLTLLSLIDPGEES